MKRFYKFLMPVVMLVALALPLTASAQTGCTGETCNLTIHGTDSYGDGWNGNAIDIYQNGTLVQTVTLSSGSSMDQTVSVCSDYPVVILFTSGGTWSYAYEMGGTITDGGGTTVFTISGMDSYSTGDTLAVVNTPCPSCIPPTALTISDVEMTSITLSWTPGSAAPAYAVYQDGELVSGSVTDTFYTFTGLEANTVYSFGVQGICSSTDSSIIVSRTGRTACGEITLPYFVDFEDAEFNGAWYPCWDSTIHAGTDPSVNTATNSYSASANHTEGGQYAMYMQGNYNEQYNLVVSPSIPLAGDQIFVSFWAFLASSYSGTANGEMTAGVMTDPHDTTTYIPLVTINSTSWEEYTFSTSSLDASATYYAAWMSHGTSFVGKIDDVTIRQDLGCNKPSMAAVDSVGPYSVNLRWTNGGSGAAGYDVLYGTENNPADENIQTVSTSDTTITIDDLLPQTTYYAWVRTTCGSDSADLKGFGSFTTQLTCATVLDVTMQNISYTAAQVAWTIDTTQGFESTGVQITIVNEADSTAEPVVVEVEEGTSYTISELMPSSSYTLYVRNMCQAPEQIDTAEAASVSFMTASCSEISSDGTTNQYIPTHSYYGNSYSQSLYLASEMPNIDTIHGIAFNITSRNSGNHEARTMDVYMQLVDANAFDGNNYFSVDSTMLYATSAVFHTNQTGWQAITFDSAFVYDGTSNLLITINDYTNGYGSAAHFASIDAANRGKYSYRDNNPWTPSIMTDGNNSNTIPAVRFMANCEVPTCYAPMVTMDAVDSTNITLSWETSGTEDEWVVGYKADGQTTITWDESNVTNLTYTYTNLTPNTRYELYVGSLCGDDTIMATLTVKTTCGAMVLPYVTGFESDDANAAPSCWNMVNTYAYSRYDYSAGGYVTVDYPAVNNDSYYAHTGNNSLAFVTAYDTTLAATSVLPTGSALHVAFWANVDNYGKLWAGLMTDITADSTFEPMVEITNNSEYNLYEFNTRTLSEDSTYYLAFRFYNTYSYNVTYVDDIEITIDNGCNRPTDLAAIGTSTNSINVSWTNNGLNGNTFIQYREVDSTEWFSQNIYGGDSTTTIVGLETATKYEIRIGIACSETDTLWGTYTVFARTLCDPMVLPYLTDFDNDFVGDMASCWYNTGATGTDYYGTNYPSVSDDNAYSGDNSLYFYYINGSSIVYSQSVPLTGDSIQVSFMADIESYYSGAPTIEAGVMTDPSADSTFVPMVTINTSTDGFQLYEFNTSSLTATETYHVAFRYTPTSTYQEAFIDDINIRQYEGCSYPTNINVVATLDTVTVSWTNPGSVNDFVVETRMGGSTWSAPIATTNTTVDLFGLNASVSYEVRVGLVCSAGDTLWTSSSFDMPCGNVAVPYVENFVSSTGTLPPCWSYTNSSYFHWNRWTTHAETSGDGEMMAGSGSANEFAILPRFAAPFSKLEISFDAKLGNISEGDSMILGVYDETTGTITEAGRIANPSQSRENFVRFTFNFLNYDGNGDRIAIGHSHNNSSDWGFALDSIVVIELPDCFPPIDVEAHNTFHPSTADDIYFTWTPQGTAAQWQVYIDTITSTDTINNIPDSLLTTVDTNYYHVPFNSLAYGARYRFFVRSFCGFMASNWVELQNGFSTDEVWMNQNAGGIVFDTVTGSDFIVFDNGGPVAGYLHNSYSGLVLKAADAGTELQVQGGYFSHGADANTLTIYDSIGTSGTVLYQRNQTNVTETLDTILATSTTGALTITFTSGYYAANGYELYIHSVGAATCPRPTRLHAEMVADGQADVTWDGTASQYSFYYRVNSSNTWVRQVTYTNSTTLTGLVADSTYEMYVIAICSATDSSTASAHHSLYAHYEAPHDNCDAPTNLTVSAITENGATIGWTAHEETAWRLDYNGTVINVTTNPYQLTGLSANTLYTVKVQAVCGEGSESEWSATTQFTTHPADSGVTQYTVTANVNNTAMGTVSGAGTYDENSTVTLTATPNSGYHFVNWTDDGGSILSTSNPYSFTLTGNVTITANFAQDDPEVTYYNVSVTSANNAHGTVTSTASGRVAEGTQVTVTAIPAQGYAFVAWMSGSTQVSTDSIYTFTVTNDIALVANFVQKQGIDDVITANVNLYPNPATDVVRVESGDWKVESVEVVDMNGRIVLRQTSLTIDVTSLSAGTYFVRLTGDQSTAVRKLIVK